MSRHLDGKEKKDCESLAGKFVKTLIDHYQVKDPAISDGQLLHGVYAKKTPYNTCRESGVDECVIWGDYYFMEALNRMLNPEWNVYWSVSYTHLDVYKRQAYYSSVKEELLERLRML